MNSPLTIIGILEFIKIMTVRFLSEDIKILDFILIVMRI